VIIFIVDSVMGMKFTELHLLSIYEITSQTTNLKTVLV